MAKFKVGDKVRIVKVSCSFYWYSDHVGEEFNISAVREYGGVYETDYSVFVDGTSYTYFVSESDIELVECNGVDAKGNPYNFTKDVLKTGMGVKYRNGGERLHVDDYLYKVAIPHSMSIECSMSNYTADLIDVDGETDLDIVQVFNWDTTETIWQRVEKPVESEAQKKAEELKREIS